MGTVTAVGKTQKWPGIWQLLGKCWEMTKNSGNGRTGGILSAGAVYCLLKVCGYVSLVGCLCFVVVKGLCCLQSRLEHIRYDTRCYINLRSKANMSQLNLPHGTDN